MNIKKYSDFVNEANKFTFKTEKPTGRYSTFSNNSYYIKLDGKQVGEITCKMLYGSKLVGSFVHVRNELFCRFREYHDEGDTEARVRIQSREEKLL